MHLAVPNKDASKATYCTSLYSQASASPLHYTVIQAIGRAHGLDAREAFLSRLFWAHYCVIIRPPALYLGLLIVGLRLGRAEVGSPSIELRALTLACSFDVFCGERLPCAVCCATTPSPFRHYSLFLTLSGIFSSFLLMFL